MGPVAGGVTEHSGAAVPGGAVFKLNLSEKQCAVAMPLSERTAGASIQSNSLLPM